VEKKNRYKLFKTLQKHFIENGDIQNAYHAINNVQTCISMVITESQRFYVWNTFRKIIISHVSILNLIDIIQLVSNFSSNYNRYLIMNDWFTYITPKIIPDSTHFNALRFPPYANQLCSTHVPNVKNVKEFMRECGIPAYNELTYQRSLVNKILLKV
jgi:hypothetical protein